MVEFTMNQEFRDDQYHSLETQIEKINTAWTASGWGGYNGLKFICSPYRICPLGAHVDHQGGGVLGRTIEAYSVMAFEPSTTPDVQVRSMNFPGETKINVSNLTRQTNWGDYLRGAVSVFSRRYPFKKGFRGIVSGSLPGSGLSSSASVGLAYLHALRYVNDVCLTDNEIIDLDQELENNYLNLDNGILDQSVIQLSRRDHFLYLTTRTRKYSFIEDHPDFQKYCFLIIYSGFSRQLVGSGFNVRVAECRQAAVQLGAAAGISDVEVLSGVPDDVLETYGDLLPLNLRLRAEHYFTEVARVRMGVEAWEQGDFVLFGRLMNESAHSSIYNYHSGSQPIIRLQEITKSTPGVYGSRFGGGGYGGCIIALVDKSRVRGVVEKILGDYLHDYPEKSRTVVAFLAGREDGVKFL